MATAPVRERPGPGDAVSADRSFFGHPRGLSTLFFSEMWERFSYYGMRGFLILYMTAPLATGGMGLDAAAAARDLRHVHVDGVPDEPAGRLDRRSAARPAARRALRRHPDRRRPLLARRRRWPARSISAWCSIVLGTGLLKPNISVIVGQLYAQKDVRRDAAFSIFYMGINLGAFLGPLITGYLAQDDGFRARLAGWGMDPNSAWHWGFGAAGVGMTLGLIQYVLGGRALGTAGPEPGVDRSRREAPPRSSSGGRRSGSAAAWPLLVALRRWRSRRASCRSRRSRSSSAYAYILLGVTVAFFGWLFLGGHAGRRSSASGSYLIVVFFVAAALFWSVFEQAGSTLNLFADRSTQQRHADRAASSRAAGGSRSMRCSSSSSRRCSRGCG